MANLDAVGIAHSGREGDIASVTTGGRQVAFIAFSPTVGSHLLLDTPAAVERVQALAATHDLVIVSFHGGAEGPDALRVPYGEEFHLGEPRGNLREFCRAVIDAGADVVFGHGPHVVRGIEIYRDRLIAYSLGNFATWWGISVEELKGVAPILVVDVDGAGRFVMGRIESLLQTRERGLVADPERQALHLMAQLSRDDFGAGAPRFDAEGKFFKNAEREL